MEKDLTAIFVKTTPTGVARPALDAMWVESVVRKRGRPAILRVAPLEKLELLQIEVHNIADGLPTEDPEMVGALAAHGAATFVHVNHEAKQAIIHGYDAGIALEGFVGEPGADFTERLHKRLGCDLEALHAADDQTRSGIGVVASRTAVLLPGRSLALPIGMPSALGSFRFHDRGQGASADAERCIFLAFDRPLATALSAMPGTELARLVETAVGAQRDKDEGTRAIIAIMRDLGDRKIAEADPKMRTPLIGALERLVMGSTRVFSAGDRVDYWDQHVLPLLSFEDSNPVIDEDDLPTLDGAASVLHALVEVVPFAAPPGGMGSVLEGIGDAELSPLFPALTVDGSYAGSILALDPTRILEGLRKLDGDRLSVAVDRLERAWYRTRTNSPAEGEAFEAFRGERAQVGQPDIDRVLRHLSELRVVLEVARVNDLAVALAFYA